MALLTSASSGGKGGRTIFWPPDAFQKRSSWQSPSHQSAVASLSVFPGTPPEVEGVKIRFPFLVFHHPPFVRLREMGLGMGGGGLTFVTALSREKVTARPLENQKGWEGSIWRLSFIYLSRHAAPGVLPGQWWGGRDNDLLVLQISSSLTHSPCNPLCPSLFLSDTLPL